MRGEVERLAGEVGNLNLQENENCRGGAGGAIMICDAWYGFPTQKRPRKERILAVSKQIHNFMQWRIDFASRQNIKRGLSTVLVIGKGEDVQAIRQRVEELRGKDDAKAETGAGAGHGCNIECKYLPDKQLEELSGELLASETATGPKEMVAYLSPDASEKLNASKVPPRIVVVGMIVDRKVQPNRSKIRAESLGSKNIMEESSVNVKDAAIIPMQLPLDALNVSDLSTDEPLNIDTCLEMMERWWVNTKFKNTDNDADRKVLFRDAAARALLTHRQRHPNRTLHGGATEPDKEKTK
jgi:hypothetical protein